MGNNGCCGHDGHCGLVGRRSCKKDYRGWGFWEVGVVLTRGEIMYDVEFVTNRLARMLAVDAEGDTTKMAQLMTAEGKDNADYIDRLIMSAVKKLRHSTSWASGERGGHVVNDEIPPMVDDWTFVFHVPVNWRGEADVLCSLCHDYVKNRVIAEWLKMVAPKMADDYVEQADENLRDVQYELRKEKSAEPPVIYDLTK